jgi:hypothetical protein
MIEKTRARLQVLHQEGDIRTSIGADTSTRMQTWILKLAYIPIYIWAHIHIHTLAYNLFVLRYWPDELSHRQILALDNNQTSSSVTGLAFLSSYWDLPRLRLTRQEKPTFFFYYRFVLCMEHNSNFEKWSTNNIFLLILVIGIVLPVGKHIQRAEIKAENKWADKNSSKEEQNLR